MQLFKMCIYGEDHSFSVRDLDFFSLYKMLTVHPRFASQSLHQNQLSRREKRHKVKNLPVKTKCLWGWQAHSSWEKESQVHGTGGVPRQSCSRWGFGHGNSTQLPLFISSMSISWGWVRRNRAGKEPGALSQTPGAGRCLLASSIPKRNLSLW